MSTYTDLDVELTAEQISIKEETHKFAKKVLRPASIELDKLNDPQEVIDSPFFWDAMKKSYELGYHSMYLSDEYGGLGLDPLSIHIVTEELGWASADFGIGIGVSGMPAAFAAMLPSDDLENKFIIPFCENTDATIIGCWAITEPEHGTDMLTPGTPEFKNSKISAQTTAALDGDCWVINGQKAAWVSNGTIATHALVYLTIDPSMGMAGGGICIIPLDLPGVKKGKPLDKIGQRALNQGEVYFDNVRIPLDFMIVDPESYGGMLDITLSMANASMGATFTGVARAAYEEALNYSKQRIQGGKVLFDHQLIKHKLFRMFTKVESARQLSRAAMVYNLNNSPPDSKYSIAAKTYCTQVAFEVASEAVQIFGGNGLSREYPIEKFFRDARASMIEDGANDTLMVTAAHDL